MSGGEVVGDCEERTKTVVHFTQWIVDCFIVSRFRGNGAIDSRTVVESSS